MIYIPQKSNIEMKIGRQIDLDNIQKVSSLNDLPTEVVDLCRLLDDSFYKECLVSYYVTEDNEPYLRMFVQTAILKEVDPAEWMTGRILAPIVSLKDLLTKELEVLYKDLEPDYSCIFTPNYSSWKGGRNVGSFVKVERNSTYRDKTPKNCSSTYDKNITTQVNPSNRVIWFRRWIASKIARAAYPRLDTVKDLSITSISESFEVEGWTQHAVLALEGLKKEALLGVWDEVSAPGYFAKDNCYLG